MPEAPPYMCLIEGYAGSTKTRNDKSKSEFGNSGIFRKLPFSNRHLSFFESVISALVSFIAFLFFCYQPFRFIGRAVNNCGLFFKRDVMLALAFGMIGQWCACSALMALFG